MQTAAQGEGVGESKQRWVALIVVLGAAFLAVLDFFIVNVSIPAIHDDLHATFSEIQLVIAGYGLTYALGLITGGRLGDIYGRKRLFTIGVAAFTATSAVCGLAPTAVLLVVARLLQGMAAAVMFPQVLSIIRVVFTPREQPKAFGLFGTALGLASLAGPLVGGILIHVNLFGSSWRPIFLVNVPLGALVLFAARKTVPESKASRAMGLDWGGVVLGTLALGALVLPLVLGRELGWPRWSLVSLALAAPLFALFLLFEKRRGASGEAPLLELSLFRHRSFSAGTAVVFVLCPALAAFFLSFTLFLQSGLGFDVLRAGLLFSPYAAGYVLSSHLSARLTATLGRRVLQLGALLMVAALLSIIAIVHLRGMSVHGAALVPSLFVYGAGQGLAWPPLVAIVIGGVPADDAGSASGAMSTVQQVANSLGVAVIGGYFFSVVGHGHAADFVNAFPLTLRLNVVLLLAAAALVQLLPEDAPESAPLAVIEG